MRFSFPPAGRVSTLCPHQREFQRSNDQKTTAKVFVTCDLTIFGIGSHSATGEEWADAENAGTASEAQAFKRAASCFRLGRYLYNFRVSGWTWMTENGLRPNQGSPDRQRPTAGEKGFDPSNSRRQRKQPRRPQLRSRPPCLAGVTWRRMSAQSSFADRRHGWPARKASL
jgi:hypothetical protein